MAVLLKECRDVQLRCGSVASYEDDDPISGFSVPLGTESRAENVIHDQLVLVCLVFVHSYYLIEELMAMDFSLLQSFKDINGLVEMNVQLRSVVCTLSEQLEEQEAKFKAISNFLRNYIPLISSNYRY